MMTMNANEIISLYAEIIIGIGLGFVIGFIIAKLVTPKKKTIYPSITQTPIASTQHVTPIIYKPTFQRRYLLTKNELNFYKKLKPIADKYNMHILCKVRVADIIQPIDTNSRSEWYSMFGRIKSRHVDFALANPENMYIILAIELDDRSHNNPKTIERDNFINAAYADAGIALLRTYNCRQEELENAIITTVNLKRGGER